MGTNVTPLLVLNRNLDVDVFKTYILVGHLGIYGTRM